MLLPAPLFADCVARGYLKDQGPPIFLIGHCIPLESYFEIIGIESSDLETISRQLIDSDKAVNIRPANGSASSMLWGEEQDYWHYNGECSELDYEVPVKLELDGHCSDVGPTKYLYLGDMTILKATKI